MSDFSSQQELELQEHLDLDVINYLNPSNTYLNHESEKKFLNRPKQSFIELVDWASGFIKNRFNNGSGVRENYNTYIHNRIVIDGSFLKFCSEKNINITCLHKDSTISWKTDSNTEKYFMQGVFEIQSAEVGQDTPPEVHFISCALFHKGNSNEDEISFFVFCPDENFEAYREFRNEFDLWSLARDRSNLHIRVIDGEDLPYTKEHTWDDLFLPQNLKDDVQSLVENFLASKDFYQKNKLPWKRGILLYGDPGNGKSSLIKTIISMYDFKPVTIASAANDDTIRDAFSYAEDQSPSLLYFEDLDSLLEKNIDASSFLNLMDGISAKNGLLVVATANEVRKLKANITDRPSRFDRKFEIPLPNQAMCMLYLKKWFGKLLTSKKYTELSKTAVRCHFSYAYLKELYISSMFEALSNKRQTPSIEDIDTSMLRLVKDKTSLGSKSVSTSMYFS